MEDFNLSIVIVNWNGGEQLYNCVHSILKYKGDLNIEIIVVDNNSSDNSLQLINDFLEIILIKAGVNLGFGKACNLGAKGAKGKYLLFLNPDAEVFPNTLKSTYSFILSNTDNEIGVCGVQLVNTKGEVERSCSRFPSGKNLISQSLGLNKLFPSLGMQMLEWDHQTSRKVDQVIGAYYFIERGLFEKVNGFDERFFVYFEEVDLSKRLRDLGYINYFISSIQAFHIGGGVSNKVRAKRLFYSWRSRIQYAFKHFSFVMAVLVLLSTIFVEPLSRFIFVTAKFQVLEVIEIGKAWWMLVKWLLNKLF